MPNMPPGAENKGSMKGEAKKRTEHRQESVAGIEEHTHAGERGPNGGVVFKLPKDYVDHSCVRTPEKD